VRRNTRNKVHAREKEGTRNGEREREREGEREREREKERDGCNCPDGLRSQ